MLTRLKARLARLEVWTLALWIAAAGAPWIFVHLADEVGEGDTGRFDRWAILALRRPTAPGDPIGPRWLEESMRDVTALGGTTLLTLIFLIAVIGLLLHGRRRQAWVFAGTVIAAQVSSEVLKVVFDRPRPALVPHGVSVYSQSFPSGHSTLAAATYFTLAMVIASLETSRATKLLTYGVAMLVVLAVGFSRVYLGVHWPTDVLGGWVLGAAWALAASIAMGWGRGRP